MTTGRLIDVAASLIGLLLGAPLILIAALGIKASSAGPVFYRARRAGCGGVPFEMLKLRTMRSENVGGALVTAPGDSRVFPFGGLLRKTKLDEVPQLWNVLRGDMAVVGPRPEDPGIVAEFYGPEEMETLKVRPGLTSPGTLWYYTSGEDKIDPDDTMTSYVPVMRHKLRMDAQYFSDATALTDIGVMMATLALIVRRILGMPMKSDYGSKDAVLSAEGRGEAAR
jgi:lipopolysaccharide/colanic/teichoic acid biosynthesis glycosyltransferase